MFFCKNGGVSLLLLFFGDDQQYFCWYVHVFLANKLLLFHSMFWPRFSWSRCWSHVGYQHQVAGSTVEPCRFSGVVQNFWWWRSGEDYREGRNGCTDAWLLVKICERNPIQLSKRWVRTRKNWWFNDLRIPGIFACCFCRFSWTPKKSKRHPLRHSFLWQPFMAKQCLANLSGSLQGFSRVLKSFSFHPMRWKQPPFFGGVLCFQKPKNPGVIEKWTDLDCTDFDKINVGYCLHSVEFYSKL